MGQEKSSDKLGQGERLCVIQDSDGDLWGKCYGAYITPIPQGEYGDLAEGDKLVAVYDPQTERVVPKGAEVWTREQIDRLFALIEEAMSPEERNYRQRLWSSFNGLSDLIAQARGKGE